MKPAEPAQEIKVQQRGRRVGGEKYCEDCGAAKPTMGDPRTNSNPDARDGVRRWCERCCTYLNQRPGAAPTHPFTEGWTYSLKNFKPYGTDSVGKETAWPKNGWTCEFTSNLTLLVIFWLDFDSLLAITLQTRTPRRCRAQTRGRPSSKRTSPSHQPAGSTRTPSPPRI